MTTSNPASRPQAADPTADPAADLVAARATAQAAIRALAPGSDPLPAEFLPFRAGTVEEERQLLAEGLARRVVGDVLVARGAPDSRAVRAAAAALLIPYVTGSDPGWVVGFESAAWLHLGPALPGHPVEGDLQVIVSPGRRRPRLAGVHGRQVALEPDHITRLGPVLVTTPLRTAADVARYLPADQALAVLRRLGDLTGVRPHQVIALLSTMRYARGAATGRLLVHDWAVQE